MTDTKKTHGSGSSTTHHWKLEVRTSYPDPTIIGSGDKAFVIDNNWREWPVYPGTNPYGINIPFRSWDRTAGDHGMFSQTVMEAHRWALLAYLEAGTLCGAGCIETRLVKIELQQSYSTKELGVTEPLKNAVHQPIGIKDREAVND